MSESLVCPLARSRAVEYYREPVSPVPQYPEVLPAPNSYEALRIYADTKPAQYALIGTVIDSVVDYALGSPLQEHKRRSEKDIWENFKLDIENHLQEGVSNVHGNHSVRQILNSAASSHHARHLLRPHTYRTLRQSLEGGASTAAAANAFTLFDFNKALSHHPYRIDVMRRSYGSVIEQASCSALQLIPLHDLRQRNKMPSVVVNNHARTADYSPSLLDIEIDDYMRLHLHANLGGWVTATTIRELQGNKPIIGCPILFRPKQIQKLWNWTIDQAVERGLVG